MKENKLLTCSQNFAIEIIGLVEDLRKSQSTVIANQIARSGTSIGANISEAQYAQSSKDFIAKLQIALKEANETAYWLTLLKQTTGIADDQFYTLNSMCQEIKITLIASIKTAKRHL